MIPYRSGKYIVGNLFMKNLETGEITLHCRQTMNNLHNQFKPDAVQITPPAIAAGPLTDEERLSVFSEAIEAALCGADLPEAPAEQETLPAYGQQFTPDQITALAEEIAVQAVRKVLATMQPRQSQAKPASPATTTAADDELYQTAQMWACAAYHEYGS